MLQWFARRGCGFDIVSGGELERVLAAGGDPARIVFSGVGKTRAEMARALAVDVLCFNVESVGELELLSRVASGAGRRARVSLRVNPDVDPKTHPYISTGLRANKFGIAHERGAGRVRARRAPARASRWSASTATSARRSSRPGPYVDALDRLLDLVERVEADGVPLAHIDVGGGLGITYRDETPPDAGALIARLLERIDARGHGHRKLLFEPGRSLVGNAGVLVSEVLYLKPGSETQLLHRRRGDERPDAAGDVRRLDAHRRMRARAAAAAPGTSSGRSANRATGSAASAASRSRPATSSPSSPPAPMR